jgi:starch phosphorylase
MALHHYLPRDLPPGLEALTDLALDLRWTWTRAADDLWRAVEPDIWDATGNPWLILQEVSSDRLRALGADDAFRRELDRLVEERQRYLEQASWCGSPGRPRLGRSVAYFSLEFGLGEALPLYAGGLGILAGDHLKAASDLNVPLVGVGLLYQQGYFRQIVDERGRQEESYPYLNPAMLPVQPAFSPSGGWLRVAVEFPGRTLWVRVWQASVGRATLYLLDSNDPLNSPHDCGITGKLYGDGTETRLRQEIVLGMGGWQVLEALGIPIDVCHLNEGHAAFVALARARSVMCGTGLTFRQALWATRAGNAFTTHTPVAAGFDVFDGRLVAKYFPEGHGYLAELGLPLDALLALGRAQPDDSREPFTTAYLAIRCAGHVNGVSRLHGEVSRHIFEPLFPRWPAHERPISHITNGLHTPSWDSRWADLIWIRACSTAGELGEEGALKETVRALSDEELWALRFRARGDLIRYARARHRRQIAQRGALAGRVEPAQDVLDGDALTVGFARRFVEYKRPNLLLRQADRLRRLLSNATRPVQLIVAGKAHPADELGKRMIEQWVRFMADPDVRLRAVFLEDYDMTLAQEMVQGVDVWLNTPRRPWEACGTSGMKVLINGGLNLSVLDGWWAEAYAPDVGWAIGAMGDPAGPTGDEDEKDAERLYGMLEQEVVPLFYDRDDLGVPRRWVARMRASMSELAPRFTAHRMVKQYVETVYQPAESMVARRMADDGRIARQLDAWERRLNAGWVSLRWGALEVLADAGFWTFSVVVYLGGVRPEDVRVELYADPLPQGTAGCRQVMERLEAVAGPGNGYRYRAQVAADRPAEHFTPRVVPHHPEAISALEVSMVSWHH